MINKAQEHTVLNNKNTQKVWEEINLFLQDIENRLWKTFLPAQKETIAEELKTASFSSMFPVDVRKKIDALKKVWLTQNDIMHILCKKAHIDIDSEWKLVLYHSTTWENFLKILKSWGILPAKYTGNEVFWLTNNKPEEIEKVYLSRKDRVHYYAGNIPTKKPWSIYILEVRIDPDNLRVDEDAYGAYEGLESLFSREWNCSHLWIIKNFSVYEKRDFTVSEDARIQLFSKVVNWEITEEEFYAIIESHKIEYTNKYDDEIDKLLKKDK